VGGKGPQKNPKKHFTNAQVSGLSTFVQTTQRNLPQPRDSQSTGKGSLERKKFWHFAKYPNGPPKTDEHLALLLGRRGRPPKGDQKKAQPTPTKLQKVARRLRGERLFGCKVGQPDPYETEEIFLNSLCLRRSAAKTPQVRRLFAGNRVGQDTDEPVGKVGGIRGGGPKRHARRKKCGLGILLASNGKTFKEKKAWG